MIRSLQVLFLLPFTVLCARADLAVTLTPGAQIANGSSDTIFSGTVTNTGTADIFLNDIGVTLMPPGGPYFTVDRNFFFESVPGVLSPGETYSGPIFKISIAKAPSGSYAGTASILGGADISSQGSLPGVNFMLQIVHRPPKRIR